MNEHMEAKVLQAAGAERLAAILCTYHLDLVSAALRTEGVVPSPVLLAVVRSHERAVTLVFRDPSVGFLVVRGGREEPLDPEAEFSR